MGHMIWLADIIVAKPRIIKSFGIMVLSKIDDLLNFISNHSTTHHKGQKLKKYFEFCEFGDFLKYERYEILFCWVLDLILLSFLLEIAYLFWCIFTQVYFYFTFETKIPNIVNVTWLSNTIIVLVIVIKI